MKFCQSVLFALLVVAPAAAFAPSMATRPGGVTLSSLSAAKKNDLGIIYDSAARLAYDEWRAQFNKGDFSEERYSKFKANYEEITVANVVAKKEAREQGVESPDLLALNEYGDYSADEYEKMAQAKSPTTTADVLSQAMEAAQAQSEAGEALEDAFNALAEDEELLAKKLGLESVEELEVALDSLQGIAPDGGELDSDNISREARIRSSYLDWCKEYGKKPDESRFPAFSSNFLVMEEYAAANDKEMNLNEFADCTEKEYAAMQSSLKSAPATKVVKEDPAKAAAKEASAKAKAEAADKIEAEKEAAEKIASAEKQKVYEAQKKKQKELAEWQAKSASERKQEMEKERADRQKAQVQVQEKLAADNEAAAIAASKAEAENSAARVAQQKAFDMQAAEEARTKSREWEEKQAKMRPAPKAAPVPKSKQPMSFFQQASKKPEPKKVETKSQVEFEFDLSKVIPAPAPAPKKAKKSPGIDFSSLFPSPAPAAKKSKPTPVPKKAKPAPVPKKAKAVVKPSPSIAVADPVTDVFASLFGAKKSSPKSKPVSVAKPAPAPKKVAPSPFFSFGSPKTAPKPTPKPAPSPTPAVKKEPFSFFGKPAAAKSTPAPAPTPAKKPTFSFFSPSPSPTKKPAVKKSPVKAPVNIPNRPGTISLFSGPPKSKPAPKAVSKSERVGTISLFSSMLNPKVKPAPKATAAPKTKSFSLFGGKPSATNSAAPKDKIPVLSRWKQNPDGSISGAVSNTENFRSGTQITTSPVKKGAKAGSVVKTGSGSQYRLN